MTNENQQPEETNDDIPVTWDTVRSMRDQMLLEAESKYNFDTPASIKAAWREYKQELRDLPTKYKDLEDLTQIEWPQTPDHSQQLILTR
jgi:hypothetical protein